MSLSYQRSLSIQKNLNSNSNTNSNSNNKIPMIEAKSKKKLRMITKANEGENNYIKDNHSDEYFLQDKQDFNDLEKWKKELLLKESSDVSEKLKKRYKHIQSLKDDLTMPELNYDIIDSVMNNNDLDERYDDVDIYNNIPDYNNESSSKNTQSKKSSVSMHSDHKTLTRSSFSVHNLGTNFADYVDEVIDKKQTEDQRDKSSTQSGSPNSSSPKMFDNKPPPTPQSQSSNKSSVFLQRNLNKQLLNNLLLNRITRKYQTVSALETQAQDQTGSDKKKQVRIVPAHVSGQSFYQHDSKYKNKSLDVVRHLFSEETENFSKTTLSSFKNVGNQFFRLASVIEYETLLRDILNTIHHPKGILNMKHIEGMQKEIEFDLESYNYLQKSLLDNYHNCTKEIEEFNKKILEERLFQTQISLELKNCHEEQMNVLSKLDAEEEILKNEMKNLASMQVLQHSHSTKINMNRFKNIPPSFDIKGKHKKIEGEREDVSIYFETLKKAINQRMRTSIEKLEIMDKEIMKIKQKRNTTKMILKDLYFKALKSDTHLSTQGLVWIIKSLININEDITNDEIFPNFLDDQSKQFLIQWAKLSIQQDEIQNNINGINLNDINFQEQYQNGALETSKISSANSREAIKQKVHKISRGSTIWRKLGEKSPGQSNSSNIFPTQDEINSSKTPSSLKQRIAFDLNKLPSDCVQSVELKNDMRQEQLHISNLIDQMKESERQRLCKKVQNNTPGLQQKLIVLQQKLQALFGKVEGDIYYNKHLKEMSQFEEKVNGVKFFKFSHINIQNTNISNKKLDQTNSNLNNTEDNQYNISKQLSITTTSTPSQKQESIKDQRRLSQKLSLNQETIQNFQEKKKSIVHNHRIMLQYNSLSDYFFQNQKQSQSNKNNDQQQQQQQQQQQPFALSNYFFKVKNQTSSNLLNASPASILKSTDGKANHQINQYSSSFHRKNNPSSIY